MSNNNEKKEHLKKLAHALKRTDLADTDEEAMKLAENNSGIATIIGIIGIGLIATSNFRLLK